MATEQSSFVDTAADIIAIFVILVVPIGAIALFWMVHVLPEKIAERRHHPQQEAIKVLCLLSLVFGGLLWPLAWLWAYSKPVLHKLAYGTDKHDTFYTEVTVDVADAQPQQSERAADLDPAKRA
jgi:hypothetical protein